MHFHFHFRADCCQGGGSRSQQLEAVVTATQDPYRHVPTGLWPSDTMSTPTETTNKPLMNARISQEPPSGVDPTKTIPAFGAQAIPRIVSHTAHTTVGQR